MHHPLERNSWCRMVGIHPIAECLDTADIESIGNTVISIVEVDGITADDITITTDTIDEADHDRTVFRGQCLDHDQEAGRDTVDDQDVIGMNTIEGDREDIIGHRHGLNLQ